jgi:hypothetical protein
LMREILFAKSSRHQCFMPLVGFVFLSLFYPK